jgi:uncharacterized repeat protein (TIGR03843 family)
VLTDADGHVYGVDHGVCFHVEDKLRTVLWGWVGDPLPDPAVEVLEKLRADLAGQLGRELRGHLTAREVRRVGGRVERLLETRCFPAPSGDWPSVPWPPI